MKRKDKISTENELLRDSPNNYMSESQLKFFKNRLESLANELLQNADETTEHLRKTSLVPDPADRASIEEEHSLELRTRDRERKLLKKIKEAILRIDKKEYGYCLETGEEIGLERLLARPTATLSLEAQQRREKRQKQFDEQAETRRNLVGSGDRSERIRTYNFPQGRVTDHRINLTIYKLDDLMQGNIDQVIQPLGNREKFYENFLDACVKHYGAKGTRCIANENDRIAMSLRQPQSMQVSLMSDRCFCDRRGVGC